jgi:hypothetical protein
VVLHCDKCLQQQIHKASKDITGISDPKVYGMVQKVLASEASQTEQIERFIESYDIKPILNEASSTAATRVIKM